MVKENMVVVVEAWQQLAQRTCFRQKNARKRIITWLHQLQGAFAWAPLVSIYSGASGHTPALYVARLTAPS
eukprot:scaffold43966_cov20-Tisochrysis_lutea.AAC.3